MDHPFLEALEVRLAEEAFLPFLEVPVGHPYRAELGVLLEAAAFLPFPEEQVARLVVEAYPCRAALEVHQEAVANLPFQVGPEGRPCLEVQADPVEAFQ